MGDLYVCRECNGIEGDHQPTCRWCLPKAPDPRDAKIARLTADLAAARATVDRQARALAAGPEALRAIHPRQLALVDVEQIVEDAQQRALEGK